MHDIPTIDIGPRQDDARVARDVEHACHEIGFMYIRGHGIDGETVTAMRKTVASYFSRPLQNKLDDRISRDNYRGYIPTGFFSP